MGNPEIELLYHILAQINILNPRLNVSNITSLRKVSTTMSKAVTNDKRLELLRIINFNLMIRKDAVHITTTPPSVNSYARIRKKTVDHILRQYFSIKSKNKNSKDAVVIDSIITSVIASIKALKIRPWMIPNPWGNMINEKGKQISERTIISVSRVDNNDMKNFATAISSGALALLKELILGENHIGDEGMCAFSSALSSGSLGSLQKLNLCRNQIGDEGMKAFSSALSSGALASLKELYLSYNNIGDEGMTAFSVAISSGALLTLQRLLLSDNKIGDEGMKAFSTAVSSGSLSELRTLFFNNNKKISKIGLDALATAITGEALTKMQQLHILGATNHENLRAACEYRRIQLL